MSNENMNDASKLWNHLDDILRVLVLEEEDVLRPQWRVRSNKAETNLLWQQYSFSHVVLTKCHESGFSRKQTGSGANFSLGLLLLKLAAERDIYAKQRMLAPVPNLSVKFFLFFLVVLIFSLRLDRIKCWLRWERELTPSNTGSDQK